MKAKDLDVVCAQETHVGSNKTIMGGKLRVLHSSGLTTPAAGRSTARVAMIIAPKREGNVIRFAWFASNS